MTRPALWTAIAETLSADMASGHYRPGEKLPTEAQLAARFTVNRHTVRRALADLAGRGLVRSRRGAGVFVAGQPADYALGRRVRFHQNMLASGRMPSRRINRLETRHADQREAEALGLPPGAKVHVVEGLSLVDGMPLAAFRSVFPARRFPDLLAHVAAEPSITAALRAGGVADYTRSQTRLTAKAARGPLAVALGLSEGAPVLRTVAVNIDEEGRPIEFGTTWFAGDRVTLTYAPE